MKKRMILCLLLLLLSANAIFAKDITSADFENLDRGVMFFARNDTVEEVKKKAEALGLTIKREQDNYTISKENNWTGGMVYRGSMQNMEFIVQFNFQDETLYALFASFIEKVPQSTPKGKSFHMYEVIKNIVIDQYGPPKSQKDLLCNWQEQDFRFFVTYNELLMAEDNEVTRSAVFVTRWGNK